MLRYIPYSVKTGIQAGMGVVLFAVGLELACDVNILEEFNLLEPQGMVRFFTEPELVLRWTPAFFSGLTLFVISHFVTESPFTNLGFFVVGISLTHVALIVCGVDLESAREAGW